MFKEFGEFAMRGNVVDLAVGFILGGAFSGMNALQRRKEDDVPEKPPAQPSQEELIRGNPRRPGRQRAAQDVAPAIGADATGDQHRGIEDLAALADLLVLRVQHDVVVGAKIRLRQASSNSSSWAAAR